MKPSPRREAKRRMGSTIWRRLPWIILAWCCIAAGAAGLVLPLLPTTPFLLLAAWASPKASPRLHQWLYQHPRLGPPLRAWREERAVPTGAKLSATILLIVSWISLWLLDAVSLVLVGTAIFFSGVMAFLWSRPAPRASKGNPNAA